MIEINYKKIKVAVVMVCGLLQTSLVFADFLELPEVKEMQDPRSATYLKDLDVPGVKERSPDPTAGPRLAVSEFRIQGLVEYPELGITREALNQLVESIRFEIMGEGKLLESGYTLEELGEVSDLLVEIEGETLDRHVSNLDLQKLVWLVREQRSKRGVTLGQIEAVASKITNFYRERGFILAKAYIPKQQVRDGIVNLTLLLGHLGEVNVVNNTQYSSEKIKSAFNDLLTRPVTTSAVEERLYLINDYPGITVDGYFEPGYQIGDTRLNINVKNESKYSANVRLDNHGSDTTGRQRLYGDVQVNNIFGNADIISLAALQAADPSNTTYWRVLYSTDLFASRFKLAAELSQNQYIVDKSDSAAPEDLSGTVNVQAASGKYIFKRSRTSNHNLELRYEVLESNLEIGNNNLGGTLDEKISNYVLTYNFDFLQEANNRLHQGYLRLLSGSFDYGADTDQDTSFLIYSAGYTLLNFWKIPYFNANTRILTRVNAQYAGSNISQLVKFSVAGPTRARAYDPSLFTADDALYLGIDWVFNSPEWFDFNLGGVNFKKLAKPFVFADYSYGTQHSLVAQEGKAIGTFADAGFGLQFSHENRFQANLMLAFPISEKFEGLTVPPATSDSVRVVFDFQYSF